MLYSGSITFGEFNKTLQELSANADKERADEAYRAEMLRAEYARLGAAQAEARAAQLAADTQERMRLDQQYRAVHAIRASTTCVVLRKSPRQ